MPTTRQLRVMIPVLRVVDLAGTALWLLALWRWCQAPSAGDALWLLAALVPVVLLPRVLDAMRDTLRRLEAQPCRC